MADATLFAQAVDCVDEAISAVTDWSRPSPCEGWTAADVLTHVTGTLGKVRVLFDGGAYGAAPAEPTGRSGEEAVAAWQVMATQVRGLVGQADLTTVVSTPQGERPLAEALALPIADLACHAWDIAASQGAALNWPDALHDSIKTHVGSIPQERLRRPGFFGPAAQVPADASPTDAMMAYLGRARTDVEGSGSW